MTADDKYKMPQQFVNHKEVVECSLEDAFLNPECDQGHSYGYLEKDLNEDKEMDNFLLLAPRFNKIIEKYKNIIKEDKVLAEALEELRLLFIDAEQGVIEDFEKIEDNKERLFDKVLALAARDEDDISRMQNESMLAVNNSRKEQFLELKKELAELFAESLVIY